MTDEKKLYVALNTVPGLRAGPFHRSLSACGSASGILKAGREGLARIPGISEATAAAIVALSPSAAWKAEQARAQAAGAGIVTLLDQNYPEHLRQIHDPPPVLYQRGELCPADREAVAVVGSRAPTPYGRLTTEKLARELASCGITVVSGLARGIDSCAHRSAVEGGGRTIAVLGSGLDRIYPPEHRTLAEKIAAAGAILTEFPFGQGPEKYHFPLRNRVISGLSLGVVVVEAAARSGALITADLALEQGREVFAVPGNISSPKSAGPNRLITQGAKLVESAGDILEEFPHLASRGKPETDNRPSHPLSQKEEILLTRLGSDPLSIDEVIRNSPISAPETVSLLTTLELKGLVRQFSGKLFARCGG